MRSLLIGTAFCLFALYTSAASSETYHCGPGGNVRLEVDSSKKTISVNLAKVSAKDKVSDSNLGEFKILSGENHYASKTDSPNKSFVARERKWFGRW